MKDINIYTCQTGRVHMMQLQGLWRHAMMVLAAFLFMSSAAYAQKPAASLEQIRNGSATSPVDPAQWQNGNAGNSNAHYVESHSIGYRALLTALPANTPVMLTMAYDIRHSSKNAIDFLTHYDRLQPHGQFPHPSQETVDPRLGTSFAGQLHTSIFEIPRPLVNTTINSRLIPASVWDGIESLKRQMTMWGGTITDIQYDGAASLTDAQSEQRITITFTTDSDGGDAVLAWGGHIANREDWGFTAGVPNSAGGISGSPYHMRLKNWSLGNLGNQDRSLSASAVIAPPLCSITPSSAVCEGTTTLHTAAAETGATYSWTVSGQGQFVDASGAVLTSPQSTGTTNQIRVKATGEGSYTLGVTVSSTSGQSSTCSIQVTTYGLPASPAVTYNPPACDETTFSLEVTCPLGTQYEYSNNGGAYQSNPVFSGIAAGAGFSITVRRVGTTCVSSATDCNNYKTVSCAQTVTSSIQVQSAVQPLQKIDEVEGQEITAYPVPFDDNATIEFTSEHSGNYVVNLYDMKGSLIRELKSGTAKQGELNRIEVDGRSLPEGMYYVRFVNGNGAKTVKLLKKQ